MVLFGNYTSESGKFAHIGGRLISFTPAPENVISGGIDAPDPWSHETTVHYDNAIRTLIVPEGIRSIPDGFMVKWAVTERMELPQSLQAIGTEDGAGNAFAGCFLPEVSLPSSLRVLGKFAFGHSYIKKLTVHPDIRSPYNRQFKDSTIEQLLLAKKALEARSADAEGYGFYGNFYAHCHCTIIEY